MKQPVKPSPDAGEICFGFDRQTDEKSLQIFLKLFASDRLLKTLIPRLKNKEIDNIVTDLSTLMRKHLTESEYHELFLDDPHHHH